MSWFDPSDVSRWIRPRGIAGQGIWIQHTAISILGSIVSVRFGGEIQNWGRNTNRRQLTLIRDSFQVLLCLSPHAAKRVLPERGAGSGGNCLPSCCKTRSQDSQLPMRLRTDRVRSTPRSTEWDEVELGAGNGQRAAPTTSAMPACSPAMPCINCTCHPPDIKGLCPISASCRPHYCRTTPMPLHRSTLRWVGTRQAF
jgi:hypothetical protein